MKIFDIDIDNKYLLPCTNIERFIKDNISNKNIHMVEFLNKYMFRCIKNHLSISVYDKDIYIYLNLLFLNIEIFSFKEFEKKFIQCSYTLNEINLEEQHKKIQDILTIHIFVRDLVDTQNEDYYNALLFLCNEKELDI